MTKIVKEYIERKIREGVQPKFDALTKNLEDIRAATPGRDDIDKAVYREGRRAA